jgi:hypothetical protein
MSEIVPITALYVFTTVVDGIEKIAVGADGLPFVYLSQLAITEFDIMPKMQRWADSTGITLKLQLFAQLTLLDIIEPMQSKSTM